MNNYWFTSLDKIIEKYETNSTRISKNEIFILKIIKELKYQFIEFNEKLKLKERIIERLEKKIYDLTNNTSDKEKTEKKINYTNKFNYNFKNTKNKYNSKKPMPILNKKFNKKIQCNLNKGYNLKIVYFYKWKIYNKNNINLNKPKLVNHNNLVINNNFNFKQKNIKSYIFKIINFNAFKSVNNIEKSNKLINTSLIKKLDKKLNTSSFEVNRLNMIDKQINTSNNNINVSTNISLIKNNNLDFKINRPVMIDKQINTSFNNINVSLNTSSIKKLDVYTSVELKNIEYNNNININKLNPLNDIYSQKTIIIDKLDKEIETDISILEEYIENELPYVKIDFSIKNCDIGTSINKSYTENLDLTYYLNIIQPLINKNNNKNIFEKWINNLDNNINKRVLKINKNFSSNNFDKKFIKTNFFKNNIIENLWKYLKKIYSNLSIISIMKNLKMIDNNGSNFEEFYLSNQQFILNINNEINNINNYINVKYLTNFDIVIKNFIKKSNISNKNNINKLKQISKKYNIINSNDIFKINQNLIINNLIEYEYYKLINKI